MFRRARSQLGRPQPGQGGATMIAQALDFTISAELRDDLRSWRTRAAVAGLAALVADRARACSWFAQPVLSLLAVVVSFVLWAWRVGPLGLADGAVSDGRRLGRLIRRPCEAAARTLPLVALLFLPIFIGIPNLYRWSHAAVGGGRRRSATQTRVSEFPFFLIRAAVYFGGWCSCHWC